MPTKRRSRVAMRTTTILPEDFNTEKYIEADTAARLVKYVPAHFRQRVAPHFQLERYKYDGKTYYLRDAFNAAKSAIKKARGDGTGRLSAKKRRAAKRHVTQSLNGTHRRSIVDKIPRVSKLTNPDNARQLEVIVTPEILMDMIARGTKMTFKVES